MAFSPEKNSRRCSFSERLTATLHLKQAVEVFSFRQQGDK